MVVCLALLRLLVKALSLKLRYVSESTGQSKSHLHVKPLFGLQLCHAKVNHEP